MNTFARLLVGGFGLFAMFLSLDLWKLGGRIARGAGLILWLSGIALVLSALFLW